MPKYLIHIAHVKLGGIQIYLPKPAADSEKQHEQSDRDDNRPGGPRFILSNDSWHSHILARFAYQPAKFSVHYSIPDLPEDLLKILIKLKNILRADPPTYFFTISSQLIG
jgi:hypothetical protein